MAQFIKINGRRYEINPDILIHLLDDYQENPESAEIRRALIDDILLPKIGDDDYKTIRMSKLNTIFELLEQAQNDLQTEIKKKRSQL